MSKALTIGKLAQLAGVGIETIRYYQKRGLIKQPVKPATGFRAYPLETVNRIHFIKRAKQLGFTLGEISHLLNMDINQCEATRKLTEEKIQEINQQINELQIKAQALKELVSDCRAESSAGCPVINALSAE